MGSIIGSVVNFVLVQAVELARHLVPVPARLGAPLADPASRPRADADPVVLVAGFANTPGWWTVWKRSLEADGFDVHVVRLSGSGLDDMERAADEVAAAVAEVKRRTGRSRVDIVGFSEGGVLARMYVAQRGGASSVDRAITVATPHHGLAVGGVIDALRALPLLGGGMPASLPQLTQGSALLARLEHDDRDLRLTGGPVRYASLFSQVVDGFITPWASILAGATNLPIRGTGPYDGPSHLSIARTNSNAYEAARLLLLDGSDHDAWAAAMGVPSM